MAGGEPLLKARVLSLVIAPTEVGTNRGEPLHRRDATTREVCAFSAKHRICFVVFWVLFDTEIMAYSELTTDGFFRVPFAFKDSVIKRFCN